MTSAFQPRHQHFDAHTRLRSIGIRMRYGETFPSGFDPLRIPGSHRAHASLCARADTIFSIMREGGEIGFSGASSMRLPVDALLRLDLATRAFALEVARITGIEISAAPVRDDPAWIRDVKDILERQASIRPIDYARIESVAGRGRAQIDRVFRASTGLSPKQYMEDRVLREAADRLLLPGETVKTTAAALGFTDPSHFCKWFRQRAGVTPGQFARSRHA